MISEWFEKMKRNKAIADTQKNVIDVTNTRNIHENIASLKLGQSFGIQTREGIKVFKLLEIRKG